MLVGIQSRGIVNEKSLSSGYKRIRQAGMTCVDYNITWMDKGDANNLEVYYLHKKIAHEYGLKFSQVHAPRYSVLSCMNCVDELVYAIEKSLEVCEILEAPFLVVHPLQLSGELGKERSLAVNKEYFLKLGKLAKSYKKVICIENMFDRYRGLIIEGICSSAEEVIEIVEYVNGELGTICMGACFDVGHANVLRKNIREEVIKLGAHLKVLHIHDNDGVEDQHQIPYGIWNTYTGVSTTDWSGLLLGLREIGYEGCLSFEPFKCLVNVPGVVQESLLSYICKIGENFWKVIEFEKTLKNNKDKKVVIFGAGKMLQVYLRNFGEQYPPYFIVDNNCELWNTKLKGFDICSPSEILSIESEKRLVIICSSYYEEIEEQLAILEVKEYILSEEILRMNGKPL